MDTSTFEITAQRLRPVLMKTAARLLENRAEAEDIVQDTMLKLWSIRSSLDKYDSVEALAVTIVRRLAYNEIRRTRPNEYIELKEEAVQIPSPDNEIERKETAEYVDFVLNSLPDSQQTLIRLRHIEGFDNEAIASLLGCSEGAVRTALSRARRQVASIFLSSQHR